MAGFVLYGVLVWWLAFRLRGSWRAYLPALVGLLGVILVGWLHYKMSEYYGKAILPALQVILYPYGALITAVGLFIAWVPAAPVGRRDGCCHACLYDLRGRATGQSVCPECGAKVLGPGERGSTPNRANPNASHDLNSIAAPPPRAREGSDETRRV